MSTLRVIRVRSVETIAKPAVKALIMRAVDATQYPGTTPEAFYNEIAEDIAGDKLGVFIGFDDDRRPASLAIAWLPWSQASQAPQMVLVYSESRSLALAIGERLREWVRAAGYDRIIGANIYHRDDAYCRVFRHVGETHVIGSLIEARI